MEAPKMQMSKADHMYQKKVMGDIGRMSSRVLMGQLVSKNKDKQPEWYSLAVKAECLRRGLVKAEAAAPVAPVNPPQGEASDSQSSNPA